MLKQMWNSLEIKETGYKLMRAKDEYEYKLTMDNKDLPSYGTNYDLHVQNDYLFRIVISMPVIGNYEDIVWLPWYDESFKYAEASKICSENIIIDCDYIVFLYGDNLDDEEQEWKNELILRCGENNKIFWEIGNNCKCFNFNTLVKWIESEENYCSVVDRNVVRL
jgi:hypothetical protein